MHAYLSDVDILQTVQRDYCKLIIIIMSEWIINLKATQFNSSVIMWNSLPFVFTQCRFHSLMKKRACQHSLRWTQTLSRAAFVPFYAKNDKTISVNDLCQVEVLGALIGQDLRLVSGQKKRGILPVSTSSPIWWACQDKSRVQGVGGGGSLIAPLFYISNHSAALTGPSLWPRALQSSDEPNAHMPAQ